MIQLELPLYGVEEELNVEAKMVNTLKGEIPLLKLGKVLIHEHVFCRTRPQHLPLAKDFLICELNKLLDHGINTIVDLTTYVLPDSYWDVLVHHPMNVICCAGYYLISKVPSAYHNLDADGLADKLRYKVASGIGMKHLKPGVLKVASAGRVLTRFERSAIRAVGLVQRESSLPVVTHACRGGRKQLEILLDAGADPRKVVLSHMEMEMKGTKPTLPSQLFEDMKWILKQGAYLFWGDFTANDTQYRREVLKIMKKCYAEGYGGQLFISTDSYWIWRGGKIQTRGSNINAKIPRTYEYTFNLIIPLLRENGFSESDIEMFLQHNVRNLFS